MCVGFCMTLMFTGLHIGLFETIRKLCPLANMYVDVSFVENVHGLNTCVCCVCACVCVCVNLYVCYICIIKLRLMCVHVPTFKPT